LGGGTMKNLEDLKSKFNVEKNHIEVNKKFINKYKLSPYDMREIMQIIDDIEHFKYGTTINQKFYEVFKDYNVIFSEDGIGWRY
jgi:hypothetical protein